MNKFVKNMLRKNEFYLFLIIVILSIVIGCFNRNFLTLENWFDLLKSNAMIGIMSLGVLIVLVSGGMDISFTAIAQVAEYVVVGYLLTISTGNIFIAFIMGSVLALIMGLANGLLINFFNIPPIIITIATYNIYFGFLYVFSKGDILFTVPDFFKDFSSMKIFTLINENGVEYGPSYVLLIWVIVLIITSFILKKTTLGRSVYSIGGNRVAAQRVGYSIFKTDLFVYGFMGLISGIAAVVHASVVQSAIPNSIVGKELDVIAVVVLGGASISGGKGSVFGTLLGVILLAIMGNGLTLLKISSYWYKVFIGAIIIISIVVNVLGSSKKNILKGFKK